MEPAKYNFQAVKGATWRKHLTVLTAGTGSSARDLTGYTATFTLHDPSQVTLLTLTSGSGITLGGIAGTIDLVLTAAQTTAAAWSSALYLLTITAPGPGDTDALLYGGFAIHTL